MTYTAISADAHILEPPDLFENRLPAKLRDGGPKLRPWEGGEVWTMEGQAPVPLPPTAASGSDYKGRGLASDAGIPFSAVMPAFFDPAERVKAQVRDGVDAEVLYPSPNLWGTMKRLEDPELRLACTRAYNDWIAEFTAHSPDRLIGLGKVPVASTGDALAEVERCVRDLKLRGMLLDAWPTSDPADPEADLFWDAIDAAGVPVSIHYSLGLEAAAAPEPGVSPGRTPPLSESAMPLVYSGLFDRLPNVRIVMAHGNAGWVPTWLEGLDSGYIRGVATRKSSLMREDWLPSDYIRRHFWFTFQHDRFAVHNRSKIGTAHLLWASHLPLDGADWPNDLQRAELTLGEVPAEDRNKMLALNCARLYRLPGYEKGFGTEGLERSEKLVHF